MYQTLRYFRFDMERYNCVNTLYCTLPSGKKIVVFLR